MIFSLSKIFDNLKARF